MVVGGSYKTPAKLQRKALTHEINQFKINRFPTDQHKMNLPHDLRFGLSLTHLDMRRRS